MRMAKSKIGVWIVEDDRKQREEVKAMIEDAPDLTCLKSFDHCEAMFAVFDQEDSGAYPDVVILDYQLNGYDTEKRMNGIEAAQKLKEHYPEIAIVMLTIKENTNIIARAIASGACGYLVKPASIDSLLSAIRQAHCGGLWMPPMVAQRVAEYFEQTAPSGENVLSEREMEVLSMMERGLKQKQIADKLILSKHTVDSHLRNIYKKLHVHSAQEALAKAIRKGYL